MVDWGIRFNAATCNKVQRRRNSNVMLKKDIGWLARYGTHIPSLSIILFQTAVDHKMSKQEIAHYRFRCPHNAGGRGIILNIDRDPASVLSTEL